jgi:hypothetical protein
VLVVHVRRIKSHFDLAGLAHADYHVDEDGVEVLTKRIISNCGYKSIHVDHPDDILLCYNEIILLHKVVVQGWRNPWMQFCGPLWNTPLRRRFQSSPAFTVLMLLTL